MVRMTVRSRLAATALMGCVSACGEPSASEPKIIGGRVADDHRFMAGILFTSEDESATGCGGAFVAPRVVVTAAHCAVDLDRQIRMRIGSGDAANSVSADVVAVAVHPQFNSGLMLNDIAVMLLAEDADMSGVTPIAYNVDPAVPADADTEILTVIGRGNTTSFGGLFDDVLRQVDVPVVPTAACQAAYGTEMITDDVICAGDLQTGGVDSCQGDSGGPIIQVVNGQPVLVGVVSWGEGCAQANQPGVYTRLSSMSGWVDAQVARFTTPVGQVDGAAVTSYIQDYCYQGFEDSETRVEEGTGFFASIDYTYRPAGPFVTTTEGPVSDVAATCDWRLSHATGPLTARLETARSTPRFQVEGADGRWEVDAVRAVSRVILSCDDLALVESSGFSYFLKGDLYYVIGGAYSGSVATDATVSTCTLGELSVDLIEQAAPPPATGTEWIARFHGDGFAAHGGGVFTVQQIEADVVGEGVTARISLPSADALSGTIDLENGAADDIFTWSFSCDFQFSLTDAQGISRTATEAWNGDWAVQYVAPVDAHGTFLSGVTKQFALTLPTALPAAPTCMINNSEEVAVVVVAP